MQSANDVSVRAKNQDVTDNLASVLIMVNETPKKIVDEILKCFTCSSLCSPDRRIFIVGKTSHNFVEIIKSALNVDVNCYVYAIRYEQYLVCLQNIMLQEAFKVPASFRESGGNQKRNSTCLSNQTKG